MDLIQFQRNLKINVWHTLTPIIEKHLGYIENLNKSQLKKGIASDGFATPPHKKSAKSEIYLESKIARGVYDESIYPAVNLYNKGDFYRAIKARVATFGIEIESFDPKADELESKYGSTIYGLTDESLKKFTDSIIDEFIEALYKQLSK